jgi:hypothetical protein
MTFETLQEDVRRYIERGNPADTEVFEQIPRLISMAERRIALELKIEGFISAVSTNLQADLAVYDKPDRWRETISFSIGAGVAGEQRTVLFPRGYEYCRTFWPDATQTDQPQFYADYDYSHWLIVPTPDAAYEAEILYYELPQLLDDEVQTNWITEYIPQLLLYATLLEAAPFLKNDERVPTWQAFYDRAAGMVNGEDLARMLDRSAVRKTA